jgi:hypothetical protein
MKKKTHVKKNTQIPCEETDMTGNSVGNLKHKFKKKTFVRFFFDLYLYS